MIRNSQYSFGLASEPLYYGRASLRQTASKISGFQNLKNGWHGDEGRAFSEKDLDDALELHAKLASLALPLETDAFPGFDGEVQVCAYCGKVYAEFTLERNSKWTYCLEVGSQERDYLEMLSKSEVFQLVGKLPEICRSSEPSLVSTGIQPDMSLRVWPSSHRATMNRYLFSSENVLFRPAVVFVPIQESFTQRPENRPSSGNSRPTHYPRWQLSYQRLGPTVTDATTTSLV
jgi:hypothetical protein